MAEDAAAVVLAVAAAAMATETVDVTAGKFSYVKESIGEQQVGLLPLFLAIASRFPFHQVSFQFGASS